MWRSFGRRQTTEWRKRSKTRKQRGSVIFWDFMFVAMFIPDIWRTQYIKNKVSGTGFRLLLQARVRVYCRKSKSCRRYDGECPPPPRTIITTKRMPRVYNLAYKLSVLQNCSGGRGFLAKGADYPKPGSFKSIAVEVEAWQKAPLNPRFQ